MSSPVASSSGLTSAELAANALECLKSMYGKAVCSFNTHSDGDIRSMIVKDKLTLVINSGRYALYTDREASTDGRHHLFTANSLDELLISAWNAYPGTMP